jgi:hypothetical protein|tara:strand:- start:830 stop:1111 length:282 start_codon:yes stop_codon:yes gene_type:complete
MTFEPVVNKVIDSLSTQILIRENWRELEKLKDEAGVFRSIIIGGNLDEHQKQQIMDYFKPAKIALSFHPITSRDIDCFEGDTVSKLVVKARKI